MQKLDRLRDLLSHAKAGSSYEAFIDAMAESMLERVDPERIQARIEKAREAREVRDRASSHSNSMNRAVTRGLTGAGVKESPAMGGGEKGGGQASRRRYVAPEIDRQVRVRDGNRCTYTDPSTGRRCEASRRLELDHIVLWSNGGENTPENLRLRCRAHNLHDAARSLGEEKMAPWFGT